MDTNMQMANLYSSNEEQENFRIINKRILYNVITAFDIIYLPKRLICRFIDDEGYMDMSIWSSIV